MDLRLPVFMMTAGVSFACVERPPEIGIDNGSDGQPDMGQEIDGSGPRVDAGGGADGSVDVGADAGADASGPPPIDDFAFTGSPPRVGAFVDTGSPNGDVIALHYFLEVAHEIDLRRQNTNDFDYVFDEAMDIWVVAPNASWGTGSTWAELKAAPAPVISFDSNTWLALAFADDLSEIEAELVWIDSGGPATPTSGIEDGLYDPWSRSDETLEYGRVLGPGASISARIGDGAVEAVVFSYDEGDALLGGDPAPGRRVASGLEDAAYYSEFGWQLTARLIDWVTKVEASRSRYACKLIAPEPAEREFALKERLNRIGCAAEIRPRFAGDSFNPADPAIWVVPPGVDTVDAGLADYEGPVVALTGSASVWQTLRMIGDSVTPAAQNQADWVLNPAAPAGLSANFDGTETLLSTRFTVHAAPLDELPSGATWVAAPALGQPSYWVVPAGGRLSDGTDAAGPRVVLGLSEDLSDADRVRFFIDAAIEWSMTFEP